MRPGNVTIYTNIICNVCNKELIAKSNKKKAIRVEKCISCLKGILQFLKSSAEGEIKKKKPWLVYFGFPWMRNAINLKTALFAVGYMTRKENSLKNFPHF